MRAATRLAVVFAAMATPTTATATPRPMTLIPGGVADEAGRIAYLQGPSGGIDAVDLSTGKTRWSDAAPQRPLAIDGERLLVEIVSADGVRLAVREARAHGKTIGTPSTVTLPPWVSGGARAGVGYSSAVAATASQRVVLYRWNAKRRWPEGMHPPRSRPGTEGETETKETSGELSVEIATGKMQPVTSPPLASLAYPTEDGMSKRAWHVDGAWCAFATETREAIWLVVRCSSGDGRAAQRVVPIAPAPAAPMLSTDGRIVVLPARSGVQRSMRLPSGETGPSLPATGNVFATVGPLVLTVSTPRETAAGVVGRRELRALSLDGTLRWTRPLYATPWLPPRQ
ncbi:MAG: hypothetical protein JWM53_2536 [bacterium]|nr:hypothetical protein [bacterium]